MNEVQGRGRWMERCRIVGEGIGDKKKKNAYKEKKGRVREREKRHKMNQWVPSK